MVLVDLFWMLNKPYVYKMNLNFDVTFFLFCCNFALYFQLLSQMLPHALSGTFTKLDCVCMWLYMYCHCNVLEPGSPKLDIPGPPSSMFLRLNSPIFSGQFLISSNIVGFNWMIFIIVLYGKLMWPHLFYILTRYQGLVLFIHTN